MALTSQEAPVAVQSIPPPQREATASLIITLRRVTFDRFRQRADRMGISASALAAMLLDAIVTDGLFDAVLDAG